jgi:hypothetical protein
MLLTENGFIIGLVILLCNDFYLKYAFPNVLTGKLSDFAGLFIFPFFISVFIPRPKAIYSLTGLFFVFWKLDLSQSFIDYLSQVTNLGVYRTVDPSDLIALTILPISYRYLQTRKISANQNRLVFSVLISIMSVFSFCATSLPRQTIIAEIKVDKSFELPFSKELVFDQLDFAYGYSNTPDNLTDTLFYLYFKIPDYFADATAIATIKSIGENTTLIKLDSITKYQITGMLFKGIKQSDIDGCKNLKAIDVEDIFQANYIDVLLQRKGKGHGLYFDNKALKDKYILENNLR